MKPVLIVQNCEAESAGSIPEILRRLEVPYTVLHSYLRQPFPSATELRAVINLGCPLSATNFEQHEFLRDLYAFVAQVVRADLPYLGICFGGQLLARVLGAKVERNPVREIGVYKVRLTESGISDPLFAGFKTFFPVIQWHTDTFRIPFGASHLAETDDCRNQVFRSGRAVALQFHLEAGAKDLANWCDTYPDELRDAGKSRDQVLADALKAEPDIRQAHELFWGSFFRKDNSLSI